MAGCQAQAHRYVGKGKDRELFTGPCVLEEAGHDGDHLPAALAYKQQYDATFNAGVDAAIAKVAELQDTPSTGALLEELQAVKR